MTDAGPHEDPPSNDPAAVDSVAEADAQRATFAQLRAGTPTELPSPQVLVPAVAAGVVGLLLVVVGILLRRRAQR